MTLLFRSFLLRAFLPHVLLLVALVARDFLWPAAVANDPPAPHRPPIPANPHRTEDQATFQRGAVSAVALVLAWGFCLTLCGVFRGRDPAGSTTVAPTPANTATADNDDNGPFLLTCGGFAALLTLVVLLEVLPGWKAGLGNLGMALVAALWLYLRFRAVVAPELQPEWDRAEQQWRERSQRRAQRSAVVRKIAAVDAQLAQVRASGVDLDLIDNQADYLVRLRREYEAELEILDLRS